VPQPAACALLRPRLAQAKFICSNKVKAENMDQGWWALFGVVVGGLMTGAVNFLTQRASFRHEREMYTLKNASEENAKVMLEEMLNHRTHVDRSFEALRKPIGGFSDDVVRRLLLAINARRFERGDGSEWYFLTSRLDEHVAKLRERA
jgi:hypothetical protein